MPQRSPSQPPGGNAPLPHRALSQADVERARHQFFELSQPSAAEISSRIVGSWQRCIERGLQTERLSVLEPLTDAELRDARVRASLLMRLAEPEMEFLQETVEDTDSLVLLADATGLVLDRRGSGQFLQKAEKIALMPGVGWGEHERGTNAIGTALVENHLIEVWGAEHFHHKHRNLCCTAAPILDHTGRVLGVLDISGDARLPRGYARAVVKRSIREIEHRWLLRHADHGLGEPRRVRFHASRACLGSYQEGVIVLDGGRIVGVNRAALRLLGRDWRLVGRRWEEVFLTAIPGPEPDAILSADGAGFLGLDDSPRASRIHSVAPPAQARDQSGAGAGEPRPWLDPETRRQLVRATRAVDAGLSVMLLGETGSGKEVFARALHSACDRAPGPFVAINCAAFPEGLIESELFGYEEGAFTGARRKGSRGRVLEADGGILFLDEIGDMPLSLQPRLLRVLQEKRVTPLGGGPARAVDCAIVCATHRDLAAMVEAGSFRADLYYRLQHVTVRLRAWRDYGMTERRQCLEALWRAAGGEARRVRLSTQAQERILGHDWPGNLRQCASVLATLVVLAEPGDVVGAEDLPAEVSRVPAAAAPTLEVLTREAIQEALLRHRGKVAGAARELGIHRATLYRRMKALGLSD